MPNEPMTLIERLRNPQWVHGNTPFESPQLDQEQTRQDMGEAADEIERWRLKKRPVAFRWKNLAGVWCFSENEDYAATMSEDYQGLYARDGT